MLQNWKVKLVYIGFGTVFGCLCTIIGMLASPVTAQRDKFGEIECTKLTVVDERGNVKIGLVVDEYSGQVGVAGKDGEVLVTLSAGEDGGTVGVHSKDEESRAMLSADEDGGRVRVFGKDMKSTAVLGVDGVTTKNKGE